MKRKKLFGQPNKIQNKLLQDSSTNINKFSINNTKNYNLN